MAIDVHIKLVKPIEVDVLIPLVSEALKEILGLANKPNIKVEGYDYDNEVSIPLKSHLIDSQSSTILFKIDDEPEIADITVFQVEHPQLDDAEIGAFVAVSSRSQRTPLEFALLGAVATAIGNYLDVPIIDDRPFFTSIHHSQSAREFIAAIKVKEHFDDYQIAAQAFYNSLPLQKQTEEKLGDNAGL
jgi:hypothetical protein